MNSVQKNLLIGLVLLAFSVFCFNQFYQNENSFWLVAGIISSVLSPIFFTLIFADYLRSANDKNKKIIKLVHIIFTLSLILGLIYMFVYQRDAINVFMKYKIGFLYFFLLGLAFFNFRPMFEFIFEFVKEIFGKNK